MTKTSAQSSLGGNGMTGNRKTDGAFRRVVEAELAIEALIE